MLIEQINAHSFIYRFAIRAMPHHYMRTRCHILIWWTLSLAKAQTSDQHQWFNRSIIIIRRHIYIFAFYSIIRLSLVAVAIICFAIFGYDGIFLLTFVGMCVMAAAAQLKFMSWHINDVVRSGRGSLEK